MSHAEPSRQVEAGGGSVPGLERLLTPQEIAGAWQLDVSSVRRIFQDEPGVFKITNGGRRKREYTTIRIPVQVYQRVLRERTR